MKKVKSKKDKMLSRLKSLGVTDKSSVALLLPKSYIDITSVITHQEQVYDSLNQPEKIYNYRTKLEIQPPLLSFIPRRGCQLKVFTLIDNTPLNFTLFGTKEELEETVKEMIEQKEILVSGKPAVFGNKIWLNNAKIHPLENAGKIIPVYAGKTRVITPDSVYFIMKALLPECITLAVEKIKSSISLDVINKITEVSKLPLIISSAHNPKTMAHATRANFLLEKLAAEVAKSKILEHFKFQKDNKIPSIDVTRWHDNALKVPFELTGEQITIINEISIELNKRTPLRAILQGDVGSGKTVTYGMVAVTAAIKGYNVGVMLPSTTLASQIYEEMIEWLPEDFNNVHLVTGNSNKKEILDKKIGKLVIGTSAMLFRNIGQFDLVIIDEQQKFGTKQRQKLVGIKAHLLEVSATPLPRSVALVKLGAMKAWRLKKNHTKKVINSKLLIGKKAGLKIIEEVKETVSAGNQAIIIYALKEDSDAEAMQGIMSVEKAKSIWEKYYPGRVKYIHSGMKEQEKVQVIQDMKDLKADLLIATTAIEVGVTIPKAMYLAVINADRFGLVSLHQGRGRLARKGGNAKFSMLLTNDNPNPSTVERLSVIVNTLDGYEIAERDLELRGSGDLGINSEIQSGSDDSILVGRKVNLNMLCCPS